MFSNMTRFESLLEAVPDALVGMDQKGVIRFVNRQTESLFGYDRDELVGRPIKTLVPESLWQIYSKHRENYFADPRARSTGLDLQLTGWHRVPGEHQFVPHRHRGRPAGDHGGRRRDKTEAGGQERATHHGDREVFQ